MHHPGSDQIYLNVRRKENRIYTDEEVAKLPGINKKHLHAKEWQIRAISFEKLRIHLSKKNKALHILDLGCGNGWMSSRLSEINHSTVLGLDTNSFEIAQAERVFKDNPRIQFICDNIFETKPLSEERFDTIILASSVQYFPDIKILLDRLMTLLKNGGEIHMVDSHFYTPQNIDKAKESSLHYYKNLGYPKMAQHYHHHLWSKIRIYNPVIKNRTLVPKLLLKILKKGHYYFPWVIIKKK